MVLILGPDTMALVVVGIMGGVKRVVDGDDDGQDPSDQRQDLVGGDGDGAVRLALAKGIIWKWVLCVSSSPFNTTGQGKSVYAHLLNDDMVMVVISNNRR